MPVAVPKSLSRTARLRVDTLPVRMTEDAFVSWIMRQEDVRAEWVNGEVRYMSPVSFDHVGINSLLTGVLRTYCEETDQGVVVGPEFMIRLVGKKKRRRVPDTLFIAKNRLNLIQTNHLDGPPDLIIEIVSPDDPARDYREKYLDYQAAGVREYWIIDPLTRRVEAHFLSNDRKYRPLPEVDGRIHSKVVKGLFIKPVWLFQPKLPTLLSVLKELGIK